MFCLANQEQDTKFRLFTSRFYAMRDKIDATLITFFVFDKPSNSCSYYSNWTSWIILPVLQTLRAVFALIVRSMDKMFLCHLGDQTHWCDLPATSLSAYMHQHPLQFKSQEIKKLTEMMHLVIYVLFVHKSSDKVRWIARSCNGGTLLFQV